MWQLQAVQAGSEECHPREEEGTGGLSFGGTEAAAQKGEDWAWLPPGADSPRPSSAKSLATGPLHFSSNQQ